MRSCLWKLEPGFQTYGLTRLSDPSCAKQVFRPQTLNVTALGSKKISHAKLHKILHEESPYFQYLCRFDKDMRVYCQKIAKNPSKISVLVPFHGSNFSQSLV